MCLDVYYIMYMYVYLKYVLGGALTSAICLKIVERRLIKTLLLCKTVIE